MTLSWVLKASLPGRHGARNSLLRRRHLLSSSKLPGFYWLNDSYNMSTTRPLSTGPVERTFSNETFYSHVLIKEDGLSILEAIDAAVGHTLISDDDANTKIVDADSIIHIPTRIQKLTPCQLLQLGSVWYMPRGEVKHNNNRSPDEPHSIIHKPRRLSPTDHPMSLRDGDYLRIHHTPRRFTRVYEQDWREYDNNDDGDNSHSSTGIPRRIIRTGNGFYVIDKPPLVPVHATVDNCLENVAHQLAFHNPHQEYVATTQRIDINTSGLLVVATKPEFAAYFSSLLRGKTKKTLETQEQLDDNLLTNRTEAVVFSSSNTTATPKRGNLEKEYKCLVCIQEQTDSSTVDSWQTLKNLEASVVRHYLEGSERAPKRFEVDIPKEETENDENETSGRKWYECLLKVKRVSPLIPMESPDCPLAQSLWSQQVTTSIPNGTRAVCEVDIQLLTGRTHQIRGQLAKLGYPIVGDEQYGGAIPKQQQEQQESSTEAGKMGEFTQLLALQCCHLGFRDADYKTVWNNRKKRDIMKGSPSDRWVSVTLDSAWWTEYVSAATSVGESTATTSAADVELVQKQKRLIVSLEGDDDEFDNARMDLLPPMVQLSPGANKYILIKVELKDDEAGWFVVSAAPGECGGPYHANVAEDTVEWIRSAGFKRIAVTGGGRIDFNPDSGRAHVYGFSYGFGKGDHAKAAELIDAYYKDNKRSGIKIKASFDDSDRLY